MAYVKLSCDTFRLQLLCCYTIIIHIRWSSRIFVPLKVHNPPVSRVFRNFILFYCTVKLFTLTLTYRLFKISKRYGIAYLFTADNRPSSTSVSRVLVVLTLALLVIIVIIIVIVICWRRGRCLCASKYSVLQVCLLLRCLQPAHATLQAEKVNISCK